MSSRPDHKEHGSDQHHSKHQDHDQKHQEHGHKQQEHGYKQKDHHYHGSNDREEHIRDRDHRREDRDQRRDGWRDRHNGYDRHDEDRRYNGPYRGNRGKGRDYDRSRDRFRDRGRDDRYRPYNRDVARLQVQEIHVQNPKEFIIGENITTVAGQPRFLPLVKLEETEPKIGATNVGELKNRITPIEKIWTSHIKQYLNDSEFVEISRKGPFLAPGAIQYGRSIIKYGREGLKQIFSRAYFKLWEILKMGVFEGHTKKINIGCVAEGPGGFIHSLIDFRKKQNPGIKDDYTAITLKIQKGTTRNAKDWNDYRARNIFEDFRMEGYKIDLSYGKTNTGDLLNFENIEHFAAQDLRGKKCELVTGDGGIECIGDKEFDYQEVFNAKLFLAEIITALKIQAPKGTFILKVYDASFGITKELLTLLTLFYTRVRIVKPITSRPGNSEKYMLCQEFQGLPQEEQNRLKDLLQQWTQAEPNLSYFQNKQFAQSVLEFPGLTAKDSIMQNISTANKWFLEEQERKLQQGLDLAQKAENSAEKIQDMLKKGRFQEQINYAYSWSKKYGLPHIPVDTQDKPQSPKPQQPIR